MMFAIPKFLKNVDMFGAPVPNFNMRGRADVKTSCGACISIVILTLTLMFGILKLEHLAQRKNPSITTNIMPLEGGERYDTASENFMMAFAVSDKNLSPKNDTRYVKWQARFF